MPRTQGQSQTKTQVHLRLSPRLRSQKAIATRTAITHKDLLYLILLHQQPRRLQAHKITDIRRLMLQPRLPLVHRATDTKLDLLRRVWGTLTRVDMAVQDRSFIYRGGK
jgi:hypothetical protein